MAFFNRRKVQVEIQHPVPEPPRRTNSPELDCLDLILWQQSMREPATRNLDLIDRVLDERLAVGRAMVPVNRGRTS